jgi:putative NADH-flavin reductase
MTSHNGDDDDDSEEVDSEEENQSVEREPEAKTKTKTSTSSQIIGLFGAHGATGKHFVKLALDAGYSIQALAPSAESVQLQNEQLTVIKGSIEQVDKIEKVVRDATFVVCMLGDTLPRKRQDYKDKSLVHFLEILYPLLMKESSVTLFLHQANSLTNNVDGTAPVISRMVKNTLQFFRAYPSIHDQDEAVKFIVQHENDYFHYIVTRPGMLQDEPSKKRLTASRSLPGPVPVTNADLAEFSLGALMEEKLYDTTPYVVGDGECECEAFSFSATVARFL